MEASLEIVEVARVRGDLDERTVDAIAKHLVRLHDGLTPSRMDRLRAAMRGEQS
jgi:hypothetical protein